MKKHNHNLDDLFAAARTSEVNISLDNVRANLSKNTVETTAINWKLVFLSISGIVLLTALFFFSTNGLDSEETIAVNDAPIIEKLPLLATAKTTEAPSETNITENEPSLPTIQNESQETNPTAHESFKRATESLSQQKERALGSLQPIVFDGKLENQLRVAMTIPRLSAKDLKAEVAPVFEIPDLELHPLTDKTFESNKGEIHYMETLGNKETISLKSYKKRGKKYLKLDRYNKDFEIIESIDLSTIIQENKRDLTHVKMINNELLLVTSELLAKEKSKRYTGHKIDYQNMQQKGSGILGEFPLSKAKSGIYVESSSNGKFLLINPKPESVKDQKKKFQKGIHETISFRVYDENLKPVYAVHKTDIWDYSTAIDDLGRTYVWKFQPRFWEPNRALAALRDANVLYQFGVATSDSLILKEDSFLSTISKQSAKAEKPSSLSYNYKKVELQGLELTVSPEGNPILYGYLKNMRGLQQLTFETDSLKPYHYSVLDFQTKEAIENEAARENGKPSIRLKVDEVFFDDASNFYVLSSSYKRHYLPLVEQEKAAKNSDFSERIPIPYYPSLDIYVHKFNEDGEPIMNTIIASSAISRDEVSSNYSYLFNNDNFSVVYLDHLVNEESEYVSGLDDKDRKIKKHGDELTIAAAKQDGAILRFNASQKYDVNLKDYMPIKYFRNKGETLVLLQSGSSYKISKLSYRSLVE